MEHTNTTYIRIGKETTVSEWHALFALCDVAFAFYYKKEITKHFQSEASTNLNNCFSNGGFMEEEDNAVIQVVKPINTNHSFSCCLNMNLKN